MALGFGILMDASTDMFLVDRAVSNHSAFEVHDLISRAHDNPKKDPSQDYFLES